MSPHKHASRKGSPKVPEGPEVGGNQVVNAPRASALQLYEYMIEPPYNPMLDNGRDYSDQDARAMVKWAIRHGICSLGGQIVSIDSLYEIVDVVMGEFFTHGVDALDQM